MQIIATKRGILRCYTLIFWEISILAVFKSLVFYLDNMSNKFEIQLFFKQNNKYIFILGLFFSLKTLENVFKFITKRQQIMTFPGILEHYLWIYFD